MKALTVLAVVAISLGTIAANAATVGGYTRSNGTYVAPYQRSAPDSVRSNNLGSQSNGGRQRDEYSSGTGATNRSNNSYNRRDNDSDGVMNPYDRAPDVRRRY